MPVPPCSTSTATTCAAAAARLPSRPSVRLLGSIDIAAPAVRTAVSRMVRQGWLQPVTLEGGPGYALTPKAETRLDDAVSRVFRTQASGVGRALGPPRHLSTGRPLRT